MSNLKYTVRWVASCVYKKNISVLPHTHEYYQYLYVKNGSGSIEVNGERFPLNVGCIHILPPGAQHSITSSEGGMTTYELKFYANNPDDDSIPTTPVMLDISDTRAESVFKGMFNEMTNMHSFYEEMLSVKLEELQLWLKRTANKHDSDDKRSSYSQKFTEVIFYMEQHYYEDISLKTLSDIAHMEKIYFLKKFKAEVGTTPVNYLRKLRINKSKKLLLNSEFNITQVATAVGFQSIHHFSNVFRALVGMSPSEYKELHENEE